MAKKAYDIPIQHITTVYKGVKLVWQAVNSCFGAGFWRNDKPWSGTDGWRKLNG